MDIAQKIFRVAALADMIRNEELSESIRQEVFRLTHKFAELMDPYNDALNKAADIVIGSGMAILYSEGWPQDSSTEQAVSLQIHQLHQELDDGKQRPIRDLTFNVNTVGEA